MKNLVLVSGVADVPARFRTGLYVVSANSWDEAVLYMAGKRATMVMFWGEGVPVERLLKAVETFEGDLLVYSEVMVDQVMASRFSRVLRRGVSVVWKEIGGPSELDILLDRVRASMGVGVAAVSGK
jgi:hypothetical protein